jgi:16S rRNA processing protein RimM
MSQINKDDCVEVGYIQKPHGLKGEVILVFEKEFEETFEELEFLFVEVDGGLVPFSIEDEGFRFKTDESAICKLEFVDSLTKAKELVGCKAYVFDDEVIESEDQGEVSTLIGMRAYDEKFGDIGLISRVDDFSGNLVITVNHPRAEIMIPLSDNIIVSIDDDKREIHLSCPNGLIEIYLE